MPRSGPGHPDGLSARGLPTLLISALAQHTRNVKADPRASLLVADSAALARDPRRAARVIVVGKVLPVPPLEEPDVRERYLALHRKAKDLLALDFRFFQSSRRRSGTRVASPRAAFLSGDVLALAPK